mgnify:CR=1 FL=1
MAEQFDAIFKKGGAPAQISPVDEAKLYKKPQPKNDDQFDLLEVHFTTQHLMKRAISITIL